MQKQTSKPDKLRKTPKRNSLIPHFTSHHFLGGDVFGNEIQMPSLIECHVTFSRVGRSCAKVLISTTIPKAPFPPQIAYDSAWSPGAGNCENRAKEKDDEVTEKLGDDIRKTPFASPGGEPSRGSADHLRLGARMGSFTNSGPARGVEGTGVAARGKPPRQASEDQHADEPRVHRPPLLAGRRHAGVQPRGALARKAEILVPGRGLRSVASKEPKPSVSALPAAAANPSSV